MLRTSWKFLAPAFFLVLLLAVNCSKFDRLTENQPKAPTLADKIRGGWLATEVTRLDGSRIQFDNAEESFLVSFNQKFLFYLLDGSLPDCSDVEQGYLVFESLIRVSPTPRCKERTAYFNSVTAGEGRELVLRNVDFGRTLVYKEVKFRSISSSRFSHLVETVFKPNQRRYVEGRKITLVPPIPIMLRDVTKSDLRLYDNLGGFWLLESLDYAGQTHFPGETFTGPDSAPVSFRKSSTLLQFAKGKMNIYRNKNVALERNVEYEVRDLRLYAVRTDDDLEVKHQILEVKNFDFPHRELRTGDFFNTSPVVLGEHDAFVFRKVSFAEARSAMGLNTTFKKLNDAE